jgi:hypothetical protein
MMRSRVTSLVKIAFLIATFVFLGACVGSTSGQISIPQDQVEGSVFFVERHDKDGRDLASSIAEALRSRGLSASSGTSDQRPGDLDFVVTYVDRWNWDMRMYLSDLRIELRDPIDSSLMGYGQSSQSSLKAMGKSHDDVIAAAVAELFKAPTVSTTTTN